MLSGRLNSSKRFHQFIGFVDSATSCLALAEMLAMIFILFIFVMRTSPLELMYLDVQILGYRTMRTRADTSLITFGQIPTPQKSHQNTTIHGLHAVTVINCKRSQYTAERLSCISSYHCVIFGQVPSKGWWGPASMAGHFAGSVYKFATIDCPGKRLGVV